MLQVIFGHFSKLHLASHFDRTLHSLSQLCSSLPVLVIELRWHNYWFSLFLVFII